MDLFGNEFKVTMDKQKVATKSSKKKTTNLAQFALGEDISFSNNNLYGEEFKIQEKEIDAEKALKSKSLTLLERLAIINEKVLSVLGKQKDNVIVIKTREQLHNYITKCIEAGRIDIDTETNNSLDPVTCKLMGPCFYAPGLKQAYVPLNHRDPITKIRLPWQLTEQDIKEELARVIAAKRDNLIKLGIKSDYEGQSFDEWCNKHSDVVFDVAPMIVMHNGKFDYEVIYCTCGIKVRPDWDTMIGARLLDENEHASLKEQYVTKIDKSQEKYKIDKLFEGVQYADVDPDIFALYAATDSMMTDKVFLYQEPIFRLPENDRLFNFLFKKIEMPIVIVTAEMEMRGVCIDTVFGEKLKVKYNKQLADLDAEIANELANLKDIIMKWKLSPEANEKVKIYPAKKTKMSADKIEKTFDLIDEDGKRYKLGKAKIDILEEPINLGSSAQLAVLFYDILKCEAVNKDKLRGAGKDELDKLGKALAKYSLDKQHTLDMSEDEIDEMFESWSNDEHANDEEEITEDVNDLFVHKAAAKLCDLILKRRGIVKLISTYIDVIPDLVKHWPDGRIRFHLNSMGTDTGRYSSGGKLKFMENEEAVEVSGINIQNIPSHNKEIRMLFRAKPGYKLVGSDYSAQEPRLTAHLSQDPAMMDAYLNKKDLYAVIAQSAFDNEYKDNLEFWPEGTEIVVDGQKVIAGNKTHKNPAGKDRRSVGKVLLLASTYGMSGSTAGQRLNKTREEGEALLESFFKGFPKVKQAIDESQASLKAKGYVEDWAGRRRHLKHIIELDPYTVSRQEKPGELTNFNPIIGCPERPVYDPLVEKWRQKVKDAVEKSQEFQRKKAEKAGKVWTRNEEMSNRKYEELVKEALKEGIIIQSWTGKKAQAMRQCFNARIQGGAASLTKLAMVNIETDELMNKWDAHLVITVHDEVIVECPEQYADLVEERLPQIMIDTAKPYINVPMSCDPYNVIHWYEDEAAAMITDEYKKLEAGDPKKNIPGLSREEALQKVYLKHPELTPDCIYSAIINGTNLEF